MNISVTNFSVDDDRLADGNYFVRFIAESQFIDSAGIEHPAQSVQEFAATASGGTLTASGITIVTTTDAIVNKRSSYRVQITKTNIGRSLVFALANGVVVPATIAPFYDWSELRLFGSAQRPFRDVSVYTKTEALHEIDLRLANLVSAPLSASYITGASNAALSNGQSLGLLSTGLLKNTVASSTGTLSTAVAGQDYLAPSSRGTTINVRDYVTGGTGTSVSPWTGWDTAITWSPYTTYYFPDGWYAYSTSPQFGRAGISIIGGKNTFLKFTGTGVGFDFTARDTPSGFPYTFTQGARIESIRLVGTASMTYGFDIAGVQQSTFRGEDGL